MENLTHALFFLQLLTLIVSLIKVKNFNFRNTIFLVLIFLITVVCEGLGLLFIHLDIEGFNVHFYYAFFLFNFIYLFYSRVIKEKQTRRVIGLLNVLFSLFWFAGLMYTQLFHYIIILGSINTIIYGFLYLRKLLMSDLIIDYKTILPFWITIAFLIFYLPSIPFFLILKHLGDRSLNYILIFLGMLMNIVFVFSFLWSREKSL